MDRKKLTIFIIGIVFVVSIFFLKNRTNTALYAPGDDVLNNGVAKEYTLAEVMTHNKKADCWTTINGGVYEVTSWIDQHPGGQQAIIGLCGIDGSAAFNGQHGEQARPAAELVSFKIGTLKK